MTYKKLNLINLLICVLSLVLLAFQATYFIPHDDISKYFIKYPIETIALTVLMSIIGAKTGAKAFQNLDNVVLGKNLSYLILLIPIVLTFFISINLSSTKSASMLLVIIYFSLGSSLSSIFIKNRK